MVKETAQLKGVKKPYQSITFIGLAIITVALIGMAVIILVYDVDIGKLAEVVAIFTGALGVIVAAYGRLTATHKVDM